MLLTSVWGEGEALTEAGWRAKAVVRRIFWSLIGAATIIFLSIGLLQLLRHPDSARIEHEQGAVFSAYLFEYPLVARPLPTLCEAFQNRDDSGMPTTLGVSDRTLSGFSDSSILIGLPGQKLHYARGVPLSTFNNFLVRNLVSGHVDSFPGASNVKMEFLGLSAKHDEDQALSVTFSNVGFNHDFSWAMFYSEVSCRAQKQAEYVYLTRDWKHGQYWYVAGVGPAQRQPGKR